ncbi:MAG TPA: ribonuclease HI [Candidatus Hydrogenedens sp.]|nr:ribonuclease HI [Candidatus Hydrogenedens sp.]HOK09268.1 ribonuclease HI [Candidatus Hydrogenedens sp.]HOL19854.1 ribonuclease HI [Candidatus Hydrogenedens sp.]HPP59446.1 ribonuclease HI [Candidatus Hydrogenedens sp.]
MSNKDNNSKNNLPHVEIYTDGGCIPNPGKGAWSAILIYGDKEKVISGSEENTTNNRMELRAAVEALKALKRKCEVIVYTDSEYLKKGMTEWLPKWMDNGWKTTKGDVKNADLWFELKSLIDRHIVTWKWIKGHSKNVQNERCDDIVKRIIKNKE